MRKAQLVITLVAAVAALTTLSRAQLQTGLVSTQGNSYTCPLVNSQGQPTGWIPGTTCQNATVTNCSADDVNFTFGYEPQTQGAYAGTILFFSSGGGEAPGDDDLQPTTFGPYYLQNGYEIVQVAWTEGPWESTEGATGTNILAAACRPATFINWAYSNPLLFQGTAKNKAGYCAQGASAGSAQIAYSLAWYGSGSYLDKVELLSGPVLSDLEQGCEVNQSGQGASPITVCPTTETACHLGGIQPWSLTPEYIDGYAQGPRAWTGDSKCAGHTPTSQAEDTAWFNQSIDALVPGNSVNNLGNTDITAWICASVASGTGSMNNSSSQGQLFYTFIGQGGNGPLDIFPVTNCFDSEGVTGSNSNVPAEANQNGLTAIEGDMLSGSSAYGFPNSTKCTLNPNHN